MDELQRPSNSTFPTLDKQCASTQSPPQNLNDSSHTNHRLDTTNNHYRGEREREMLSRVAVVTVSPSAVSANSSRFLCQFNKKISFVSNPLHDSLRILKWKCNYSNMSRMKSSASKFVNCASAQPLKNPDELIDSVETFIFDCDGVIWKGDKLIDGVPETLDMLRSKGKRLVFVTNNSTKSRKQYGKKFETLGLNVSEEEIFASSFAAAAYLKSINFPKDKKVYVIGEDGILKELELAGIPYLGGLATARDFDIKIRERSRVASFSVVVDWGVIDWLSKTFCQAVLCNNYGVFFRKFRAVTRIENSGRQKIITVPEGLNGVGWTTMAQVFTDISNGSLQGENLKREKTKVENRAAHVSFKNALAQIKVNGNKSGLIHSDFDVELQRLVYKIRIRVNRRLEIEILMGCDVQKWRGSTEVTYHWREVEDDQPKGKYSTWQRGKGWCTRLGLKQSTSLQICRAHDDDFLFQMMERPMTLILQADGEADPMYLESNLVFHERDNRSSKQAKNSNMRMIDFQGESHDIEHIHFGAKNEFENGFFMLLELEKS
ncbi:unnamed protein product [Ilex paraguariensis]|uniref:Phosphoglycolate phosphatase n=1 Tax=Ilex paraguariensis TaxID=185542 RepID=A0ABC8TEY5_9AQUA